MSGSRYNEHEFEDRFIEISDLSDRETEQKKVRHNSTRKLWLGSNLTREQKRRRLLWTSGIVLVALVIFLTSLAPVRELIVGSLRGENTPSPNAPNLYFVQILPGWGTLTIDGKTYDPLPTMLNDQPIQLTTGKHNVRWVGEPFEPLHCALVVASKDKIAENERPCHTSQVSNDQYNATLITFPQAANLKRLPANEQESLKDAVQHFLDRMRSSETVQPGERYKLDYDASETFTAHQELQATQSFQLDTDTSQPARCQGPTVGPACTLNTQDCRLFCTVPVGNDRGISPTKRWDIFIVARDHWEFQSVSGTVIKQQSNVNEQFLLLLRVTREHGQWQVAFQPQGYSGFNNPACTLTMGTIFGNSIYGQIAKTQQNVNWQFAIGPNAAAGCVAGGHLSTSTGSSDQDELRNADVYIVTRFNVLQAGNDKTHELWPNLPRSNDRARQIINDIVRQPKTIS